MNESNRNTRTLIVSFVVAIMALIPLRFVEVGQSVLDQPQVLGVESSESSLVEDQSAAPMFEAPYDEIENKGPEIKCMTLKEATKMTADIKKEIISKKMSADQISELLAQVDAIEANTCR